MKKLFLMLSISLLLFGCAAEPAVDQPEAPMTENDETTETDTELLQLTIEELAAFDGKGGNKAYVAVDGKVYDVTNNRKWLNGDHEQGMSAGRDLSEFISSSPHGADILKQFTVVGKIVE
jgi:predicted heme/steroid binding protein